MSKVGVLLHVYHLQSRDWERLVWGKPERDQAGTGAKLFEFLMDEPAEHEVMTVVYSGPSERDGLSEGAYTKQFLLSKLDKLGEFPRFRRRLEHLSKQDLAVFQARVEGILLGETIENTLAEVASAAKLFEAGRMDKVVHIAAASHAPRCILIQADARQKGLIPTAQPWLTIASDISFSGRNVDDTLVLEPPHRADDPLLDFAPTLSQVLKPYSYSLSPESKKGFIMDAQAAMLKAQGNGPRRA